MCLFNNFFVEYCLSQYAHLSDTFLTKSHSMLCFVSKCFSRYFCSLNCFEHTSHTKTSMISDSVDPSSFVLSKKATFNYYSRNNCQKTIYFSNKFLLCFFDFHRISSCYDFQMLNIVFNVLFLID